MGRDNDFLNGKEAVEYLAARWGMPYNSGAFRALRFRHPEIKPAFATRTATFWRQSDLDKIEKPTRTGPRGTRKSKPAKKAGKKAEVVAA